MAERTLHLSDDLYRALLRRAKRLRLTPEQALARLLAADLTAPAGSPDASGEASDTAPDPTAALAAVQRLTSLFADLGQRPDIDALLDDPLLPLANADLHDSRL